MKRVISDGWFQMFSAVAGLCVMIPMTMLLEQMSVEELKAAAHELMPLIRSLTHAQRPGTG